MTPAQSDGWTENVMPPGRSAVHDYPLHQRAALLWYHDHVMGVTQFNLYAGLDGLWIVRDTTSESSGFRRELPSRFLSCSRTVTSSSTPETTHRPAPAQDRHWHHGVLRAPNDGERQDLAL